MLSKWLGICITALSIGAAAQTTNTFPSSGNVGVGTTNPATTLDVDTNVSQSFSAALAVRGSDGHFARLYPSLGAGNYNYIVQAGDQALIYSNGSPGTGGFVIAPQVSGSTSGLRMDQNGNVGIGTTTPAYALDVAGQIHSSTGGYVFPDGSTQTTAFIPANCGADFAESVRVTGSRPSYEPGDLMVIDPNAPGKFLKSSQAYSTLVAGIYSTKPGFVGRFAPADPKATDPEVPMAMVGRVPTKVSAENGPIKVGDLLVTSSTPGYAMKGTDRSLMLGAVVGKALARLNSGTGVIEVLVTLQ